MNFLKAHKAAWEKEAEEGSRRGEEHISFAHFIFLSALRKEDVDKLQKRNMEAFQKMFSEGMGRPVITHCVEYLVTQ